MTAEAEPALGPERRTYGLRRATLSELAQRLEQIRRTTKDVVVDTRNVVMTDGGDLHFSEAVNDMGTPHQNFPVTRHAKTQISEKTGFPMRYWDACDQAGYRDLVAQNVNRWLQNQPGPRLFRVAEGQVRAVLSNRFRALDNYDLALTVADRAVAHKAEVLQCDLSETHMAVKLTVPGFTEDVTPGDTVVPGILVTNSEVGASAFRVEAFVWRLVCRNGLVSERAFHQVHVGAKLELGEVQWRDDTREAEDNATWRKVRDIVDATFAGQGKFGDLVAKLRGTTTMAIAKPVEVTDTVARNLGLTEELKTSLLRYFAREGDTVYGLVNGITRLAQDAEDPMEQIALERAAGNILADPRAAGVVET